MREQGGPKNLKIVDLDNAYPRLYYKGQSVNLDFLPRNFLFKNSFYAGFSSTMHAFLNYGAYPDPSMRIAVLGNGNTSQGVFHFLSKFTDNIRMFYRKTMSEFKDDEEEPKRLAVLCAVSVILRVSGLQCEALRRMSIIGDAFLPFAMSYICQKRPDMKNFAIVFVLMMGLFLLFVKDVSNPNPGSLELYPYKTIFGG